MISDAAATCSLLDSLTDWWQCNAIYTLSYKSPNHYVQLSQKNIENVCFITSIYRIQMQRIYLTRRELIKMIFLIYFESDFTFESCLRCSMHTIHFCLVYGCDDHKNKEEKTLSLCSRHTIVTLQMRLFIVFSLFIWRGLLYIVFILFSITLRYLFCKHYIVWWTPSTVYYFIEEYNC